MQVGLDCVSRFKDTGKDAKHTHQACLMRLFKCHTTLSYNISNVMADAWQSPVGTDGTGQHREGLRRNLGQAYLTPP